jgi:hypothetical protein
MRHLLAGCLAVVILGAVPASAQKLKDVRELHVLFQELDDDAITCGLVEDSLDAAVQSPLSQNHVPVGKPWTDGTKRDFLPDALSVEVVVLRDGDECIGNVGVDMLRVVSGPSGNQFGAAVWSKGILLSGPRSSFSRRVREALDKLTRQWVAQWQQENPS